MKAFLSALAFVIVAMVASGLVFQYVSLSATEAYSTDTARVDHFSPVDGRLRWAQDL